MHYNRRICICWSLSWFKVWFFKKILDNDSIISGSFWSHLPNDKKFKMKKWGIYSACFSCITIIHILLNYVSEFESVSLIDTLIMDFFLAFITAVFIIISDYFSTKKNTSPFLHLSFIFLKMFTCLLFLIPVIKNYDAQKLGYVLQFFIIYFTYLFIEILILKRSAN